MHYWREYPVFCGVGAVLAVVGLGAGGLLGAAQVRAGEARRRLERTRIEYAGLVAGRPAPTAANAAAILAEWERVRVGSEALRRNWRPVSPPAEAGASGPLEPAGVFFELSAFVERMGERARQAQVAVKPDERFGFAAFAHEGPSPSAIPRVRRERLVLEPLLVSLLAAGPCELSRVQCERPPGSGLATEGDGFSLDPRLSVRASGVIDSLAFRIAFTGRTPTLRRFLHSLAEDPALLVVCAVEVEPAVEQSTRAASVPTGRPSGPTAAVVLVAENLSRFTVTIERLELLPQTPPAS